MRLQAKKIEPLVEDVKYPMLLNLTTLLQFFSHKHVQKLVNLIQKRNLSVKI